MLSIIIPAYNEENRIIPTLNEYASYFKDSEIIVVNDGSKDSTEDIVRQIQKKYKNIRLITQHNQGKGMAILTGFKHATRELIAFVDADNATKPEQLDKIIKNMDDFDVAFGSRYLNQSVLDKKRGFREQLGSRGFNLLARLITGLNFKDTQCGAKVFKKPVIDSILNSVVMSKWAFDVSLLYASKKKSFRLKEIPISWNSKGDSKFNVIKSIPRMFLDIIRIRLNTK